MADLRIFSYLPNPRLWKATITARICNVAVDIRGAKPPQLPDWLWDFEAHELSDDERQQANTLRTGRTGFSGQLHKTDAFLRAHPFGTVPAAFSPDGAVGIFESNSIMRAVARLDQSSSSIYGSSPYEAARIDSFLDASLVFARDSQIYLLAFGSDGLDANVHSNAARAFGTYLGGIEHALATGDGFVATQSLSLADICFVCELALFSRELTQREALTRHGLAPILHDAIEADYPHAYAHFHRLRRTAEFAPDTARYLEKLGFAS